MGTRTILEIARDVAGETGLSRPLTLFGFAEGDEAGQRLLRAMIWVCRYLARHYGEGFADVYTSGSIGKDVGGYDLGMVFAADSDVAWPDDELLHLGAVWKILHGDNLADGVRASEFDQAVIDFVWNGAGAKSAYQTADVGIPGRAPETEAPSTDGLRWGGSDW